MSDRELVRKRFEKDCNDSDTVGITIMVIVYLLIALAAGFCLDYFDTNLTDTQGLGLFIILVLSGGLLSIMISKSLIKWLGIGEGLVNTENPHYTGLYLINNVRYYVTKIGVHDITTRYTSGNNEQGKIKEYLELKDLVNGAVPEKKEDELDKVGVVSLYGHSIMISKEYADYLDDFMTVNGAITVVLNDEEMQALETGVYNAEGSLMKT